MNRRGFLGSLLTAAAALTLDPEELLWKPTRKIFIPPVSAPGLAFKEDAFRISLNALRQFDPSQLKMINRMDVLYGFGQIRAEALDDLQFCMSEAVETIRCSSPIHRGQDR